jgi:hypothetical protein
VVPEYREQELDGYPLTGPLSFTELSLEGSDTIQNLTWKASAATDLLKVYWSPTHHFAEGAQDEYFFLGEVPSDAKYYALPPDLAKKSFFKVLVVGKHNSANTWKVAGKL